jgi:hypothetical protein
MDVTRFNILVHRRFWRQPVPEKHFTVASCVGRWKAPQVSHTSGAELGSLAQPQHLPRLSCLHRYYTFHCGEGFEWGLAQLSRQALEQGVTVRDLLSALHRSVQKVKQGRLSLSRLHSDLSSQLEEAAGAAG